MGTIDLKNNNKYEPIENVYSDKNDLKVISKPVAQKHNLSLIFKIVFLAIFILLLSFYFIFFKNKNNNNLNSANWYAVRLTNGETYFGRMSDTKIDPLVLSNVYYNYDQKKSDLSTLGEDMNLRLVKRGQETHGPTGSMMIFKSQVAYIEALKSDSKVLSAILNYEK
jgi:hypothetical protein